MTQCHQATTKGPTDSHFHVVMCPLIHAPSVLIQYWRIGVHFRVGMSLLPSLCDVATSFTSCQVIYSISTHYSLRFSLWPYEDAIVVVTSVLFWCMVAWYSLFCVVRRNPFWVFNCHWRCASYVRLLSRCYIFNANESGFALLHLSSQTVRISSSSVILRDCCMVACDCVWLTWSRCSLIWYSLLQAVVCLWVCVICSLGGCHVSVVVESRRVLSGADESCHFVMFPLIVTSGVCDNRVFDCCYWCVPYSLLSTCHSIIKAHQ